MKSIRLPTFLLVVCACAGVFSMYDKPKYPGPPPIKQEYNHCWKCGSLEGGMYGKGPFKKYRSKSAHQCIHEWTVISKTKFKRLATLHFGENWLKSTPWWRSPEEERIVKAEAFISDPNTSEEIKDAIRKRVVIKGMCPLHAFAAAGEFVAVRVDRDRKIWKSDVLPAIIVAAQCDNPDGSLIDIIFRNKTQMNSADPIEFRARFMNGRVVLIDQKRIE